MHIHRYTSLGDLDREALVEGFGFRVSVSGLRLQGLVGSVQVSEFLVISIEQDWFRVASSGFRVWIPGIVGFRYCGFQVSEFVGSGVRVGFRYCGFQALYYCGFQVLEFGGWG